MRQRRKSQTNLKPPRVALLVNSSTQWGREILFGVNAYAREHGPWELQVETHEVDELLKVPGEWSGDGIIARVHTEPFSRALAALRVPVVNVSGIELPSNRFPRVANDLAAAARLAHRHFAERGFFNFGYFSLLARSYVTSHRTSFAKAAAQAGHTFVALAASPAASPVTEWNPEDRHLSRWLMELPKPVGILTWNAGSALEILNTCRREGLRVPDEIAVLSGTYDDVLCELSDIPISGIRVEAGQIGYQAAARLDCLFRRGTKDAGRRLLIPPTRVMERLSTNTIGVDDPVLVRALAFFRAHLADLITVSDAARHSGISRRGLERRFRAILRRTPAEEICRLRLDLAKQLLAETDRPLSDIAEACGFGTHSYFSAQFRADSGVTPREFRLQHKRGRHGGGFG